MLKKLLKKEIIKMNEKFYKYLLNKGLNENGANECINRIERGAPDREDKYHLNLFKEMLRKEKKNE